MDKIIRYVATVRIRCAPRISYWTCIEEGGGGGGPSGGPLKIFFKKKQKINTPLFLHLFFKLFFH